MIALLPWSFQVRAAGERHPDSTVQFSQCTIGNGTASLVAQCANVVVPLDNHPEDAANGAKLTSNSKSDAQNAGQTIELSVARIPARRQSNRQDAFTLISGGPGQSAIDTFPSMAFAFHHIMRNHDVILIDQRGTGGSAKLTCEHASDSFGLDTDADLAQMTLDAQRCLEALPYDPAYFTTSMAVHDLEFIRNELNISQWNIYGISYGTRVGLHYLRRYPEAVRTLTLDAVLPPSVALGPDISALSQRALDLIFERCAENSGCNEAFGNLSEPTMKLLLELEENPRNISYEDIATGKLTSMEFTRQHLAVTIRLMTYSAQTASILPSMLHDAIVNNNFAPLARQANLQTHSLENTLATGMHHAVVCSEDAPFIDENTEQQDESTYLGPGIIEALRASCEGWPVGLVDADFKEPLKSETPVLILSGEADPITPPDYGERLMRSLSNARHIINPDQGHMQAPFGCLPVLIAQFVESKDPKNLDLQCLERLRPTPFFVDANGPLP